MQGNTPFQPLPAARVFIHGGLSLQCNTEQYTTVQKQFSAVQYEKWNNIPHYTQTEINGRGPCEPSLTS